jgi:pimeloyl-ACP methyl ester carboxylesterase
MLFIQGTRDALADLKLLRSLVERLGNRATLKLFEDADHSFHVPARSGRRDEDIRGEMLDALSGWIDMVVSGSAIQSPTRPALSGRTMAL